MRTDRFAQFRPHIWPVLLLVTATLAVYGQCLGHDFIFNWDDNAYVAANEAAWGFSREHVRAVFSSYYAGNYAPLQMLSYMLDYELWGLWPGGFILTNILLHLLNGLLAYGLFLRLHGERLLATVGAALFLLHPVQVESVAWISQRKNLLAMFFFLLAWWGYCRYRRAAEGGGRIAYTAALAAFVLALLAKSAAVIFPVVIVLYDYCFPPADRRMRLRDKIPFVIAAAGVAALALHSQLPEGSGWGGAGGGRMAGFHGGSPLATFFTMLPVFCRYLGMLFWPAGLSAAYDPPIYQSFNAIVAGSALLLVGIGLMCGRLFRLDRRLGFWPIFFFVGFLPVSQIVPLITLMNDRYFYFPLLGASALAGAAALFMRDRWGGWHPAPVYLVIGLPLILLSVVSFQRTSVWRDARTLWSDAVARSPNKLTAWEGLGEAYHLAKPMVPGEALRAYQRALEIDPSFEFTLYNLGVLYTDLGEYDKGYTTLKTLLNKNPDHVMGWSAMGDVYLYQKKYPEAENAYKRAHALQPEAMQVVTSLGKLALIQGKFTQARTYYAQVEAKGGADPLAAYHLACLESQAGRKDESLAWLEKALRRGYGDYDSLARGNELSALWGDPRFHYLLDRYFSGQSAVP
jgi:tetratricopeptide (TPR) repeat protein